MKLRPLFPLKFTPERMIKLNRIKIERFKKGLMGTPRTLAEHSFRAILVFFLIALALGAAVFYQYALRVQKEKIETAGDVLEVNNEALEKVSLEWQERNQKRSGIEIKKYLNPFKIPLR